MKPDIKAKWVAALRSGEYEQDVGCLRHGDTYCCLGVLCDLHAKETGGAWGQADTDIPDYKYLGEGASLPGDVLVWSGLAREDGDEVEIFGDRHTLAHHNDCFDRTFAQIADAIEAQL